MVLYKLVSKLPSHLDSLQLLKNFLESQGKLKICLRGFLLTAEIQGTKGRGP